MKRITTDQTQVPPAGTSPTPPHAPPVRDACRAAQTVGLENEWSISPRLDDNIEHVIRDAIRTGGSLPEVLASIAAIVRAEQPELSEAMLDRRLRAQLIADS